MKGKFFSKDMGILLVLGLGINILMVHLTNKLALPLYLDSIGTIFVAALGGILPGITVGFFSNFINYLCAISPDPLTLYYGFISVLLAVVVCLMLKQGLYKKLSVSIESVFVLALIGGGLGSVLTWLLYGFSFGENVSSNLVMMIYNTLQCPPFLAQLLGDYLIDIADKGISILIAGALLVIIPKNLMIRFPYGYKYVRDDEEIFKEEVVIKCRKMSLKWKLTLIIVTASFILGMAATLIGMFIHEKTTITTYEEYCRDLTKTIAEFVEGDHIDEYLEKKMDSAQYEHLLNEMTTIVGNNDNIQMISVFCVEDGRNRSIFNIGKEQENKSQKDSYLVWPSEFQDCIDQMEMDSQKDYYNIKFGNNRSMFSVQAVYNAELKRTAYVAIEMSLDSVKTENRIYFVRIFSLLFGIGIIIVGYVFWFYDHSILKPIKTLIMQTEETAEANREGKKLRDVETVDTGDELEILFKSMCDAEDSLIQSDQASKSKTEFLSKLSHEIRTPLNSVIGFSNLAINERKTIRKEELLDYMQKIQLSGNYLLELVSDVLDISRIEEGRMTVSNEACRLDELVEEIENSFQGQMKSKSLEFVVDKDYNDILLYMDTFHTIQILNNLISNAYKYTEEGGVVGFEIHAKQLDAKNVRIQFIVQDTGIGMSKEFQKKIFEPFTQDKRGMKMKKQLRGSGLGMSICKNLVELLGGTITLESEEGEGSCFTVTIDYELIGRANSAEFRQDKDYSVLDGRKILVVDDLEMNRVIVEKSLSLYGLKFEDAEDGMEAVEKFKKSSTDEFFAIFMDVQMPEMNGYEATREIRRMEQENRHIPIVGMTADAFSDDVKKAKESGMDYHVTKPIQVQKVLNILLEIAEKK